MGWDVVVGGIRTKEEYLETKDVANDFRHR